MSFEFSRVGAQYALDIVTGRNAGPGARTVYLAILTAAPNDATTVATMAEVSTSGYARQAMPVTAPTAADPPETHNSTQLTVGPFVADPPNATHFALVSSSSGVGGDFLAWGALTAARDGAIGDSLVAAIGAFSLTCT